MELVRFLDGALVRATEAVAKVVHTFICHISIGNIHKTNLLLLEQCVIDAYTYPAAKG